VYTIGRIARIFGLSRSTLLYYDSIGLLTPTGRSDAGYRLYSEDDRKRLERINDYLVTPDEGITPILLQRMIGT
jgi:DNA-binding transcriptional MerR regulator